MTVSSSRSATWRVWLPALVGSRLLAGLGFLAAVGINRGDLHESLLGWDARSYATIAAQGYPDTLNGHDAFLPGYPLLIRLASLGFLDPVWAGLIVSLVAEAIALDLLVRWIRHERADADADFASWWFVTGPMAFFLTAVYTESAFLAAAIGTVYFARRGDLLPALLAATIACSIRITGAALLPFLVIELWRHPHTRLRAEILLVPLALLPWVSYGLYMRQHIGDPFAFFHAQELPDFGHHFAAPWDGLSVTLDTALNGDDTGSRIIFGREVLFGAIGAGACLAALIHRRFPFSLAVYCIAVLFMATAISFWRSVPRYELALFPLVLLILDLTARRPWLRQVLVGAGLVLLVWGSGVYGTGDWLG